MIRLNLSHRTGPVVKIGLLKITDQLLRLILDKFSTSDVDLGILLRIKSIFLLLIAGNESSLDHV